MEINHERCYRALATRDARFDGLFFVGVTTTRVYCRPVCAARTPRQERCRFFANAAGAERAGFRPCLRCRPELAPGHSSVDAVSRVARDAASRIQAGALNDGGRLEDLASDLGVSTRQLRRVVRQALGVSPIELAQTHRLLLAKQLLTETNLPVIEVAFASGFESVRRFNALFRKHYRLTPTSLRRARGGEELPALLRLRLGYRPPLAWTELINFLGRRAIVGVESVGAGCYLRTIAVGRHQGWLKVSPHPETDALCVEFSTALAPVLPNVLARLRHLFDLNARPDLIAEHLGNDPRLGPSVRQRPGLRVPGAFSGFEMAWRAVLGQRISVAAATTLARRLTAEFGEPIETPYTELNRLSPTPERIAQASADKIARLGISSARALTIQTLAREVSDGRLRLEPGVDAEATIERLQALPGIGEWTAQAIAMRALGWPDAFPYGDLGLLRGLGETSPARLRAQAEAWRPWRSYAAIHVWNGLLTSTP